MTLEKNQAAQNATNQPGLGQILSWAAMAAALAPPVYLGAWPWTAAIPIARFFCIIGRWLAGVGPERGK